MRSTDRGAILSLAILLLFKIGLLGAQEIEWPVRSGAVPSLTRIIVSGPPALRVGTPAGPEYSLFNGVAGAVLLPDGTLAVGDAGNHRVVFVDSTGRWLRSVGRKGDGPGEFRQPRWMGRCGPDRLGFQDGVHGRLSLFTFRGNFVGTSALPLDLNFDRVLWCSPAGDRLLILMNQPHGPVHRGTYLGAPVALLRTSGTAVDTVFRAGVRDFYFGKAVSFGTHVPLGRDVHAGAGSRTLYICPNSDGRCHVFDTAGTRVREFTLNLKGRRVRTPDWGAALRQHFDGEPSRSYRVGAQGLWQEIQPRKEFPLFDQLRVDQADNLWVRTYDGYTTGYSTWLVVSPTGVERALVAIPRSLFVLEIGRDHILGLVRDTDGVERVELYRVPQLRTLAL